MATEAWEPVISTYTDELAAKGEGSRFSYKAQGSVFATGTKTFDERFWIRSDPTVFAESAYNAGTTYDEGDRVESSDAVWESLQGSNTGNTPAEGDWWTKKYDLESDTGDWHNCHIKLNWNRGYGNFRLSKWNEATDAWDSVDYNNVAGPVTRTDTYKYTLSAGRYKVNGTIYGIAVFVGDARITCYTRPWDNTMSADEYVRTFDTSWGELETKWGTPLTQALIDSGRLTSINYTGGTEEGT